MNSEVKFAAVVDRLAEAAARGSRKLYPIPKKRAENILKALRKAKAAGVLPVPAIADGSMVRRPRTVKLGLTSAKDTTESPASNQGAGVTPIAATKPGGLSKQELDSLVQEIRSNENRKKVIGPQIKAATKLGASGFSKLLDKVVEEIRSNESRQKVTGRQTIRISMKPTVDAAQTDMEINRYFQLKQKLQREVGNKSLTNSQAEGQLTKAREHLKSKLLASGAIKIKNS